MRGTAGKNFYRRLSLKAQTQSVPPLPELILFTLEQAFGGWAQPDKAHFANGARFNQIYLKKHAQHPAAKPFFWNPASGISNELYGFWY